MRLAPRLGALTLLAAFALFPNAAHASFHVMQIERVIGGVNNDVTAQAIQLRLRSGFQNQLQNSRLIIRDAAGNNPIILCDPGASVPVSAAGSRVLIASPQMALVLGVTPNFTMTKLIPPSYLAAGRLTFEDRFGTIYWSFAYGGAGYTGTNTGSATNDADGNFGPPFPGPLPFSGTSSVFFTGTSSAPSTNNAANYALSAAGASFTNNAGTSAAVVGLPPCSVIAGTGLFVTPSGGTSLLGPGAAPIPAGFFGPGSDPFTGVITLGGVPLAPSSPLGPTDTVIRRGQSAVLAGPGSSAAVPIEIVALNLVSLQPITVTYNGGTSPEQWNVSVCLSNLPQQTGQLQITAGQCPCGEGGTFSSQLPILPKLTFTRSGPPGTAVFDYGVQALPPIQYVVNGGHWLPADPGANLAIAPPGQRLDGDCNAATPLADLPPTTNFVMGGRADHCLANSCVGAPLPKIRSTTELSAQSRRLVVPAPAALGADGDADGIPDAFDNCASGLNIFQTDTDDDGFGDLCDNCGARYNPCQEDANLNSIGDACEVLAVTAAVPARIELSAPAPNPARDVLGFSVSLPRAAGIRLEVFDLRGGRIGDATELWLAPGVHRIDWKLSNSRVGALRTGAYYLRLSAGGVVRTRSFRVVQ